MQNSTTQNSQGQALWTDGGGGHSSCCQQWFWVTLWRQGQLNLWRIPACPPLERPEPAVPRTHYVLEYIKQSHLSSPSVTTLPTL
jgi:hypothetical protein